MNHLIVISKESLKQDFLKKAEITIFQIEEFII